MTYDDLEEPTFGTVLDDGKIAGSSGHRLRYVYAPRSQDDPRPWSTSYGSEVRFADEDVWAKAKDPESKCCIVYDPRVDFS